MFLFVHGPGVTETYIFFFLLKNRETITIPSLKKDVGLGIGEIRLYYFSLPSWMRACS